MNKAHKKALYHPSVDYCHLLHHNQDGYDTDQIGYLKKHRCRDALDVIPAQQALRPESWLIKKLQYA